MKVVDTRLAGVKRIELDVFSDERGYFVESYRAQRHAALFCGAIAAPSTGVAQTAAPSAGALSNTLSGDDWPELPRFVQDNSSYSHKGVLRGLHFQRKHPQGKLVYVSHGEIFDVAVDLRRDSPTFGQWEGMVLRGVECIDDVEDVGVSGRIGSSLDAGGIGSRACESGACVVPSASPTRGRATLTQLWIPPGYAHGFVVLSDTALVHYKCTDYYHPEDQACLHWNDPDLAINWPVSEPVLSRRDSQGLSFSGLLDQRALPDEGGQFRERA